MIETRKTLASFIREREIRISTQRCASNPNMEREKPDRWADKASHWHCVLTAHYHDRSMQIYFSQGSAHTRPPKVADVLDCLAADAASIENAGSFEEWATDSGYDTDSRKAERTYRICYEQAEQLKQFLGEDDYKELLWNVERE